MNKILEFIGFVSLLFMAFVAGVVTQEQYVLLTSDNDLFAESYILNGGLITEEAPDKIEINKEGTDASKGDTEAIKPVS